MRNLTQSMVVPERRLTVRECAWLQTFPDDYAYILPHTADHSFVSTSGVLAYYIAKNIETKWNLYFGR